MFRTISLAACLALTLASTAGCIGMFSNTVSPDVVKTKAGSDLACNAVTVEQVAGTSWKASGCGKVASYTCWTSVGMGSGTCTREGAMPPQ